MFLVKEANKLGKNDVNNMQLVLLYYMEHLIIDFKALVMQIRAVLK